MVVEREDKVIVEENEMVVVVDEEKEGVIVLVRGRRGMASRRGGSRGDGC